MRPALVVLAALAVTVAAQSATRAPIRLDGTATIRSVELASDCIRADAADAKVVECAGAGSYAGKAGRGAATYTWHWHLFHGGEVPQTAHGDEDAIAVLRLGTRGTLRLTLRGEKAAGASVGTWRFTSGTKQFARRTGSGRYRFETTSGANGFRSARLVLRGTLR